MLVTGGGRLVLIEHAVAGVEDQGEPDLVAECRQVRWAHLSSGGFQRTSQQGGSVLTLPAGQTSCMSGLPETDVVRVQRWCRGRVPEHVRDQVRIEVDLAERSVTIVECRPPWRAGVGAEWTRFPIARLRYTRSTGLWSLYWRDRNLRFHEYDRVAATESVEDLLAEVDRDPTAIFWG
jgi:DUF3024 family protein